MSTVDVPAIASQRSARRGARAELVPLVDQPVSSASNFALNTLVARASTATSFATFTIASTVYLVLQGALRGGLHFRLLAHDDAATRRAAIPRLLGTVLAVSIVVGAAFGAVLLWGHALAAALLCFLLPVVLLQDAQRFAAFVTRRDGDALAGDLAWLGATVVLVGGWAAFGGSLTPAVVTSLWAAGAAFAVGLLLARRYAPGRQGAPVASWTSGRAAAAGGSEFLVAATVTFGAPLLAAFKYGAPGVASMRASLVFFAPCLALLPGLHTPAIRVLGRVTGPQVRSAQHALAGLFSIGAAAAVVVLVAARHTLGPLLLGDLWITTAPVIAPAACFIVARFVELPAYGAVRVNDRPRSLLVLRLATSAVLLGVFGAAMVAGWTLVDAYWALAGAALVCAVLSHIPQWDRTQGERS
jgi:hypothetical protein